MGAYNELTDLEFCENNRRRSRSSGRIVQSLFSIPNWIVLAGGMAIGTMLGQSSSSASPVEGVNGDVPMVESYSTKEIVSCGPWGGAGGTPFYDGRGDIVEILVTHNAERVLCIETSYNQGNTSFKAVPHGTSSAGAQSTQVTLQFPEEYVVQVKGTIDTRTTIQAPVVSSLTLVTNKTVYGPFGRESGTSFESLPGGRVVGFFGRSGTLLDQLGVLSHPSRSFSTTSTTSFDVDEENWVAVDGPWGGADGSLFHDGHGRILEIIVTYHKNHVNSLQIFYEYGAAQFASSVHGVPAGKKSKISLHHPEENLVKVRGTIGKISSHDTVTSLTFITNKHQFGPYGSPTGEAFESSSGREVTGFFGRCNSRLGQIGVITGTPGHSDTAAVQGPWGAEHGSQFCSGRGELTEIYITFTKAHLVALQTTYSLGSDKGNFKSDSWGGEGPARTEKISLHSPEEYIIQVKGTIDAVNGKDAVTSLTFVTNQRTCGPYGSTSGKSFESTPAKIGGFFGRCESHIHQLGVITELSSDIQLRRMFAETIVITKNNTDIEERLLDGGKLVLNGEESNNHTGTAQKMEHLNNGMAHYPGSGPSYVTKHLVSSDVLVIQQGPWGGSSGQEFYDGRGDIVDLNISYNDSLITSIQVGYEQGGTNFQAPLHGGKGTQHVKINMDSSTEHVLQVKGTSGLVDAAPAITSLTVVTNKATYGPYGGMQGKRFQSSREGTVVGFFGRASATLHQLGVITLINAAPSNGQCIRCATPYMYCCQCIVQREVLISKLSMKLPSAPVTNHTPVVPTPRPDDIRKPEQPSKPQEKPVREVPTLPTPRPDDSHKSEQPSKPHEKPVGEVLTLPTPRHDDIRKPKEPSKPQEKPVGEVPRLPTPRPDDSHKSEQPSKPQEKPVGEVPTLPTLRPNDAPKPEQPSKPQEKPVGEVPTLPTPRPDDSHKSEQPSKPQEKPVGEVPTLPTPRPDDSHKSEQPSKPQEKPVGEVPTLPTPRPDDSHKSEQPSKPQEKPVGEVPTLPTPRPDDSHKSEQPSKPQEKPVGEVPTLPTPRPDDSHKSEQPSKPQEKPVGEVPTLPTPRPDDSHKSEQPSKPQEKPVGEVPTLPTPRPDDSHKSEQPSKPQEKPVGEVPTLPTPRPDDSHKSEQPSKPQEKPVGEVPTLPTPRPDDSHKSEQPSKPQEKPVGEVPTLPTPRPDDSHKSEQPSKPQEKPVGEVPTLPTPRPDDSHKSEQPSKPQEKPVGEVPTLPTPRPDDSHKSEQPSKPQEKPVREVPTLPTPRPDDSHKSEQPSKPQEKPVGEVLTLPTPRPDDFCKPEEPSKPQEKPVGEVPTLPTPRPDDSRKPQHIEGVVERPEVPRGPKGDAQKTSTTVITGSSTEQWWFDWIRGTHVDNVSTVQGPWGLKAETNFYDGNGIISEIEVAYSKEFILRIQTTYVLNGMSFKQSPQGGPGGDVAKVTLQFPDEYLVQVRGTTREVSSMDAAVTSLTFVTNKRTYGPYGSATRGSSFETTRHGRVMGFYGRATSCVHSIGVLTAKVEDQPDTETVVVQEAWGGQGGVSFYEGGGEVTELLVSYSDRQVVSLQTTYRRKGKSFRSNQHGGQNSAGAKQAKITLKSPEEYLVQVKGSSYHVNRLLVIESLEFVTNKQRYGPYGASNPQGQLRSTQKGGKVVGFFGKAGHFLDQLGAIVSLPSQRHDLVTCQGSWGGPGGSPFSDGRGEIVELLVKYNKKQVVSLQVTYEQGGSRYKSQLRGGVGNGESTQVSFGPGEYLVQVKGTTGGIVAGGTMVTSLIFITNRQTHGPFGAVTGGAFETKASGKVVGVFGRSGSFLDSIGFITELRPGKALPATMKLGPWGGQGGREFCCGQGDVVKVVVYHNRTQINGIQVTYEQGGVSFEPVTYGGTSGTASEISVDFPDEYVTQVQGTTAKVGFLGSHQVITSLTFITNKHKYGPYGAVKGSEFGSPPSRLVTGFYGKAGDSLEQFGVFTTVDSETSYTYLQTYRMEWTTTSMHSWATTMWGRIESLDAPSVVSKPGQSVPGKPQLIEEVEEHVGVWRDPEPGYQEWSSTITSAIPSFVSGAPTGSQAPLGCTELGGFSSALGILSIDKGVPDREPVSDAAEGKPKEQSKPQSKPEVAGVTAAKSRRDDLGKPQPGAEVVKPNVATSSPKEKSQQTNTTTSTTESVTPGAGTDSKAPSIGIKPIESPSALTVLTVEKVPVSGKELSRPQPRPEVAWKTVMKPDQVAPAKSEPSVAGLGPVGPAFVREDVQQQINSTTSKTRGVPSSTPTNNTALSSSVQFGDVPASPLVPTGEEGVSSNKELAEVVPGKAREPTLKRHEFPSPGMKDALDDSGKLQPGTSEGDFQPGFGGSESAASGGLNSSLLIVPGASDNPSSPSSSESDQSSSSRSSRSSKSSCDSASSVSESSSKSGNSSRSSSPGTAWIPKMPTSTPIFGKFPESHLSDAESSSGEDGYSITGSTEVEGPWGGDGGDEFYDGTGDLHEIRVAYSKKHVTSLQFVYVSDGVVTEGTKFGGSPGDKFIKVVLKSPEEYIICIKGTFGVVSRHKIITSLTFVSNKAVYGPYGTIEGQEFTSSGSGKVVGIFGSAGSCVDRLGVFSTTTVTTSSSTEGSWGGDGGYVFSDGRGDIVEITVTYNRDQIVSFQAIYNQNGTRFAGRLHGGYGGKSQSQTIVINFPDEYLTQVQGTYGRVHALSNVITSLSFITSKKTYGPFGAIGGQEFKTSEGTRVVGFHGRSCDFLDRFGVFATKDRQRGLSPDAERDTRKVLAQGPWGGAGGSAFYDGRGDIVEILIEYTEDCIVSLQATYEQGGGVFKTTARFGPGGETAKIKFDQEQEQLLQIQGSIGDTFDTDMITSLTFITTKKTYGPYGTVTDRKFESKKHGKVVGFFGRSDEFLDQIGVVTEYSPKDYDVIFSQGPWGGKNGTVFYDGKGSVVGIIVTYNQKQIISFQAIYSQGTAIFKADFHGGPGGKTAKIFFNSPSEELLQVKGTTGKVGGDLVVTSLTFCSNERVFGPFGSVRDTKFESSPSGKVKGFYGKAGVCLDQIGFITQFSPKELGDEVVVQGPWGGPSGNDFYGGRGEILDIMVSYSKNQIMSLQMTYEHNGTSYKGEKQGADGGDLRKISLKETNSYLVQIKGTFGKVADTICITSLTFVTSKHTYGPFGSARGTHFQSYKNGKIVGLFGKASTSIDQLGVITQICAGSQVPRVQMKNMGPWGGQGGVEFHDGQGHIRDIDVHYTNHQVVAFQAIYEQGGIVLHGTNHGGTSKASRHVHHAKISFHGLDEYLIQITGTYGLVSGGKMITSLTFITNKQKYGPFGHEAGESFGTPSGQKIMGFFGRAAAYLDQIGVVVTEKPPHQPLAISPKSPKLDEIEERVHVEGPWGVDQETNFYGGRGNIVEIEVAYNKDTILRIQTTFQENGTNFKQEALGGPGGEVAKVTLQYPDEYLVQVKGTTREVSSVGVAVTTLTFITNKRLYGPYGSVTGGSSFETTQHGRVMGFYGRATSCLHSIGVLAEVEDLPDTETVVVQDAWGGRGGEPFFDGRGDVTEVLVTYNDLHVVSLQITYRHGGKIFKAKQHGGQNGVGAKQAKITLSYPDEYLMQLRGSSHNVDGYLIMESLDFITNKRSYGPYGALKPQGQLRTTSKNGKIVGFFGNAGYFLDQLGVIITFPSQRDDLLICQGSWGGLGGSSFCDGRGEIVELHLKYNKKQIISLQVTYEQGGVQYKSQLRGGGDNGESKQISFGPGEYLVQVKGTTGIIVPGGTMVTSLTIITNKQSHGPFGAVAGCAFETKASGKVVGLFGRSGRFLDSIGFITELHPGKALPATVKLGPWGGQGGREFYGGQGDIVKVVVYHNEHHINGIQTTYEQGGVSFEPVTFGDTSGHASEISLDFPNEYLAQVKGTTAKVGSHQVITSLTFITNKHKYGPYGHQKGSDFKSPSKRLVTGFFGQAGDALDQFGIFAIASSGATDRYLRVHLDGWKNSWGAFIKKEVSSAGKFFREEFGKLPSIGHSHSQRGESGSSSPKGEFGSEKGESGRHSFRLSLSGNLKPWRV